MSETNLGNLITDANAQRDAIHIAVAPVVGFPGYMIGNDGLVWSNRLGSNASRPASGEFQRMNPASHKLGYLFVYLYRNGKKHKRYIHRLIMESFVSACPDGMECRHLDGNPKNNNVGNLKWGTRRENEADKILHGTSNRGSRNGNAKLTERDVSEIRARYSAGRITQQALAVEYGVSDSGICQIITGKAWGKQ